MQRPLALDGVEVSYGRASAWPAVIFSNMDAGDSVFACEVGAWNVTRARRDVGLGRVGQMITLPTLNALAHNEGVTVDPAKVEAFRRHQKILRKPVLLIERWGQAWFIDGHHRLRAHAANRTPEIRAWLISEADEPRYRVTVFRQEAEDAMPTELPPTEVWSMT